MAKYSRLRVLIGTLCIALITVAVLYLAVTAMQDRDLAHTRAKSHASIVALALDEYTHRVVLEIDTSLTSIAERIANVPSVALEDSRYHPILKQHQNRFQNVRAIVLLNADGVSAQSSMSLGFPGIDLSAREYFRYHRDNETENVHFSGPTVGRRTGKWFIGLSRRLTAADGSFKGVVLAIIRPQYFLEFYKNVDLGDSGSMSVFLRNGVMLARLPFGDKLIGRSFAGGPLFSKLLKQNPIGVSNAPKKTDGIQRVVAHRALKELPLVVTVGINDAWAMSGWRARLSEYMVLLGVMVVAVLVLTLFSLRYLGRLETAEHRIMERNLLMKAVAESAADAIISIDKSGQIVAWNTGAEAMFGVSESMILGSAVDKFIPEEYLQMHSAGLKSEQKTGVETHELGQVREFQARRFDGSTFPMEISISSWVMEGTKHFTGIIRDISKRKEAEKQIRYLASHDVLTGLPNRLTFMDRLNVALAQAKRMNGHLAVLFIDLDQFKSVNDTYGHEAGDHLLKETARRLERCIREADTAARIGGDEFTVILSQIDKLTDIKTFCEKLLATLNTPYQIKNEQVFTTASIGVACYPENGGDADDLVRCADDAMYRVKRADKKGFEIA